MPAWEHALNDQAEIADMHHQHALVHEKRIGLPGSVGAAAAEMVDAALLERRHPRNLAAVIEMIVEQQLRVRAVDHAGAELLQHGRGGDVRNRYDLSALEAHRALVEHAG